jgi:beta-lactamase regulating signal transducer with metallopeptidase domain
MASVNSWLSPGVMHALGWTLIHSLWQCLGVAALAAALMALSRRPSVRYLVAVGALVAMLALPVATFFVLMKSDAPAQTSSPAYSSAFVSGVPATANTSPVAAPSTATGTNTVSALENFTRALRSPSNFPPNLLPWLVGAWLFGVALFSLRFAGGFLLLEHRRRRQSTAPSPRILAMCQELQRQLGLDRAIRYLECSWLQAPAVIGWFRPIILLPVAALTGLSEEQLRAVVAHELAHIRRLDAFVNLFQILVETLLFYHPAMWWLNKRICAERELCCDEIAVSLTGNRLEYAQALTRMAEWRNAPVLAMAANRGPLSERVLHILGQSPVGAGQRMLGLTGGVLFLTAALAAANAMFGIAYPIPMAHAQESLRAALSSGQVAVDHAVRQALQASEPATKDAEPANLSGATGQDITAPDQTEAKTNSQPEKLVVPSPSNLSRLLPTETLVTPTVVASNVVRDPKIGPNDQPAAPVPPMTDEAAAGDAQASLNNSTAAPTKVSSDGPPTTYPCHYDNPVWGRVISPEVIQMTGFSCHLGYLGGFGFGSCPNWSANPSAYVGSLVRPPAFRPPACKFDVTMNVHLADPADASKMQPGKIVSLAGDFRAAKEHGIAYITVTNAKVLYVDPFDRTAASQPASKASPAFTAVASNELPSGVHDPDALTCDAPQLVPLAKAVGWRICVQNSIAATFSKTGALSPGGTVVRSLSDLSLSQNPTGEGDPDAVTCREQQRLTAARFSGPIACAHNDFWAKLDAAGCTLNPYARAIIRSGTTKNFLNPLACARIQGRNGILPPSFF